MREKFEYRKVLMGQFAFSVNYVTQLDEDDNCVCLCVCAHNLCNVTIVLPLVTLMSCNRAKGIHFFKEKCLSLATVYGRHGFYKDAAMAGLEGSQNAF